MSTVKRITVFVTLCLALICTIKTSAAQSVCSGYQTKFIGESCNSNGASGNCFFGTYCPDGTCINIFDGTLYMPYLSVLNAALEVTIQGTT